MSTPPPLPPADDYAEFMNALPGGYVRAMGMRFVTANLQEVVAELTVGDEHLQPYGIAHGGVYSGLVESVASVGAGLYHIARGEWVVGVENKTRFLRPCRPGAVLRATGRAAPEPAAGGDPLWTVDITDAEGRIVASGQLRLKRLPPGTTLDGRPVGIAGVD